MTHLSWVEISRDNFRHNLTGFRGLLRPQTQLLTVVKSNAYGHGLVEMGKLAVEYGSDWLGVVSLDEALKLRAAGVKAPILVLSFWEKDEVEVSEAIEQGVSLVVYDYRQLDLLEQLAGKLKIAARAHLKFDVGTTRLGLLAREAEEFLGRAFSCQNILVEGIFSHLAASEEDAEFTARQKDAFQKIVDLAGVMADRAGCPRPLAHLACSAAGMLGHDLQFDMTRLGIAAYGLWPSENIRARMSGSFTLKPVLSWHTKIIQVKTVPAGTSIGYDCTYKTERDTQIAVLPVGYYDGIDRHLSNCGEFLVRGVRCPIRGRVCMNLTMIDVTGMENVRAGEEVTLIGEQAGCPTGKAPRCASPACGRQAFGVEGCPTGRVVSADDWARWIGTINYEVVTRINSEIKRIYI